MRAARLPPPERMAVAFHPRRPLLATGGQDGVGRLWQLDGDAPPVELEGDAQWLEHLAWSPDGELLVTASGRLARVWKAGGAAVTSVGPHASNEWLPAEDRGRAQSARVAPRRHMHRGRRR